MKPFSFFLLSLFCVFPSSLRAQIRLTEFCAENLGNLTDEDGDTSDWIEIHNPSQTDQSLLGWSLTDNGVDSRKWSFAYRCLIGFCNTYHIIDMLIR